MTVLKKRWSGEQLGLWLTGGSVTRDAKRIFQGFDELEGSVMRRSTFLPHRPMPYAE